MMERWALTKSLTGRCSRAVLSPEDLLTPSNFNSFFYLPGRSPAAASAATLINIRNARKHFEKLERVDGPKHSLLMR